MRYLVDTNAWIGFFEGRKGFSVKARKLMTEHPEACRISMASIWEASIKLGIGKLKLPYDLENDLPRILEENGFGLLHIEYADAAAVKDLEPLHGDPFDRIQVVQARRRQLKVISRDPVFTEYGLNRIW